MEAGPTGGGQRDGQGPRRRREIVAAVQRLLGEWGSSERLTMRAVAKEVGISAPSIYLHFQDKTELVWAALEDRYGELAAQMAAAALDCGDEDPRGGVRARARAYCRFALGSPGHYRLMFEAHQPAADPSRIGAHPARRISAGLRDGLNSCAEHGFGLSLPVEQAAQTLWAGLHGMLSLHHSLYRDESSEGLVLQLSDGLVDSLVARGPNVPFRAASGSETEASRRIRALRNAPEPDSPQL
ncbi:MULTISPECIES: TetR/AcrR family transcriptional regulator [Streptomyces]|uniref:TetR/AcrR family transcriptional regulator n=2 Tax=Streptomyces TaxID=1883 RepID=A0ABU2RB38_9ACTN|nr:MULTISPECIES: TetR/AcrR family transcriptional regulator [unclassified Streptomyces]MDT0413506.1 TetR/AcrR family transcriptional regulator [Streptomyces sp. DSM 41979]MYQ61476.1 TetR family transcriptional regulator [Streptomyces sp. SID4926]SCE60364.1 transcriptional regulator, TetR family [Streptomyces sp. DfronAA-171]